MRFEVKPPAGRTVTTRIQRVDGRFGPQVVCAPLRGLRAGRRYRIRIVGASTSRGAQRVLRAVKPSRRALPQEGCF